MKESETPSRRKVRTASRGDAKGPNRGGLVRVVGASVIALSALSQEYGSGINFVMPQSLGKYPGVETLVPLAMFTAGIVLIPQVALFTRYASIMPRAGSSHVWLTRTLGPYLGFAVAFLWFIGICGAMGFLAYATGVFVADTLHAAGLASDWPVTKIGHLTIGLASIWTLTALHASGVRHYGYLVYAAGVLVFIAAAVVITIGFWTDPHVAVSQLKHTTGIRITSRASHPSTGAFISVVAFFMFAYGGLTAAVSLGGEAKDPQKTMPRGIIGGWIATLILYTLISFALFHAVPWWAAQSVVNSGHGYLLTVPALVGLLAPQFIAIFLNVLVTLIVIKTIAPQLLDASRFLYAWAEDGFVIERIKATNAFHAPSAALFIAATIGSLFLIDAVSAGWEIGVLVRAISVVLTFAMLGLGTLITAWWVPWRRLRPFAEPLTRGRFVKVMAICALVTGLPLIAFAIHEPDKPWYFQPWFQLIVAILISLIISSRARARALKDGDHLFAKRFRRIPEE